jgi:hypothetical protein
MPEDFKVIVSGSRNCKDEKLVYQTISNGLKTFKKKVTTIIQGDCRGVDKIAKKFAEEHGINCLSYPANWNDIKAEGAVVKERINPYNGKKEKYNCMAGFQRNEQMAMTADALISINTDNSPGTKNMVKLAQEYGLEIYEYEPEELNAGDFMIDF